MNGIWGFITGLLLIAATAAGQSIRITFSANDRLTAAPVQLDSVRIENPSTMRDTVIKNPFIIDLDISTWMRDRSPGLVHSLEISGNFANPFTDATNFTGTTGLRGRVQLELYSLAGKREAFLESQLEAGTHAFSLNAASLPAGVYLLTARSGESSRTVRIVKNGPAGAGTPFFSPGGSTGVAVTEAIGKPGAAAYRFIGYAGTFHPDTVTAAPVSDTSVVFMMRRLSIPPVIESFACLTPNLFPGDTARFEITARSAINSLSKILIDFENDGVMDDSIAVTGGSAQAAFTHVYSSVGRYDVRACAEDLYGNSSCGDLDSAVNVSLFLPVLTTAVVTDITATTGRSGGNISSDGGYPVTARGVCWSTSPGPTTVDSHTTDGAGTGSFESSITGLAANTTYYVRAYAINSMGAGYGNEVSFTTQQGSGGASVTIGTQVWMLKNLDVDKYRNGDPIPQVTDPAQWASLTTGAWCYYNNDPANAAIYGKLYNWYAVNDPRGLAPAGWHVPTDEEWTVLTTYLGGQSVAGGKLKEAGTAHWSSPNVADNSSGFTALPGGCRYSSGTFSGIGSNGLWWSSTAGAWARDLACYSAGVGRYNYYRYYGFSVRCVRD